MNSKYLIGLILLIFTACSAPLTDEQKKADAVYLKQIKEYTLNSDGTSSYHYYHKMLYNSYLSINRFYGETFVVYNPQFQTLKVNKSETRMADGKLVKSPDNAFNIVLPGSAADAPAYNYLREMVITHVGLERGAIVELDYEIQTNNGFMPYLYDRVNLCETSPVKEVEIIVRVPKGEKLNYCLINQPVGANCKISSDDKYDVYKWESFNLNAYSHEPLQAEGFAAYPFLTFSTTDFSSAFKFLKDILTNTFVPDEVSKNLLNDASKGWDKVNLIKNYVASNINTYGVLPQLTGYRFRSPEEVWKDNGGTEGEKAILLAAMLKDAGFNAQTVVAGYAHNFNQAVGFPGVFDKFWIKVELDGETRYFSAVDDHSKVPGQRLIIGLTDDVTKMTFEKPSKPTLNYTLNAEISMNAEGKIAGTSKLMMNKFEDSKGLLSGIQSSAYSSKKTSDAKDAITYSLTFTNPNLAEKVDGYFVLNLPSIGQGIASVGIGDLPFNRLTAIELPGSFTESYSFSFTLPNGLKIISPSNKTIVENSLGLCSIELSEKDGKFVLTRNLSINKAVIPAENYVEFRQIMTLWADKNLNKIVVKAE
jgi:hypothetical protein